MKKRLSKSLRKYIRVEKSRIRGASSDLAERQEKIQKIYDRFKVKKI